MERIRGTVLALAFTCAALALAGCRKEGREFPKVGGFYWLRGGGGQTLVHVTAVSRLLPNWVEVDASSGAGRIRRWVNLNAYAEVAETDAETWDRGGRPVSLQPAPVPAPASKPAPARAP